MDTVEHREIINKIILSIEKNSKEINNEYNKHSEEFKEQKNWILKNLHSNIDNKKSSDRIHHNLA